LFESLTFELLFEHDVLASCSHGRTRQHELPELFWGFLYCEYENGDSTRIITPRLHEPPVSLCCGFDRRSSRDAVGRSLTDYEPGHNPGREMLDTGGRFDTGCSKAR
jgi:hypothetical protein